MSKRGNGEGSITQLADGRYQARVSLADGRRKAFYAATRAEVAAKLTAALRDRDRGLPVVAERETLGHFLEGWLETVRAEIEPSSWRRYGDYIRVHLVPGLGKTPLVKLTAQQVQHFYAQKQRDGMSATTVGHMHGVLHRALEDAERWGMVQRNVTKQTRRPKRSTKEMHALTEEEAQRFLAMVEEAQDRFRALYVLALTTGMRQGELLALRWQDVDLEHGALQVRVGLQEADTEETHYRLAEPKTPASRRRIGLTAAAVAALHAHHARQGAERLKVGEHWDKSFDLVFANRMGGLMNPDNLVKRSFKPLLRRAGLPDIRFHDLRHTCATTLLARGVHVKVVSEMLGHANVVITMRVYAHVMPHMQDAAVALMDRIFGSGERPSGTAPGK